MPFDKNQLSDRQLILKLDKDIQSLLPLEEKMNMIIDLVKSQKEQIDNLQAQLIDQMEENKNLKKELKKAWNDIDDLQQRSRLNNIIINGIPEAKNEDVYKLVENIGLKLNICDPASHIQVAHRVKTTIKEKSKPIVVRLLNTKTRDVWTAAYRQKKMWEQKIYLNEHLTRKNQNLLKKTKTIQKEHGFKFVWVRDCKIFIRKNESSRVFVIRSEEDFDRVLGKKWNAESEISEEGNDDTFSSFTNQ